MTVSHRRRVAIPTGVAAVAAAAIAIALAAAPAASADAVQPADCITLADLGSVQTSATFTDAAPAGYSSGDQLVFTDDVLDASGAQIGTSSGRVDILVERPTDQHLIALDTETFTLTDGTIMVAGFPDISSALAGNPWSLQAVGTAGRYAGLTGTLQIRNTSPTSGTSTFTLC